MADTTTTRVITVKTKYESLKDLRDEINRLNKAAEAQRAALKEGEVSSAEYEKAIAALKNAQSRFNETQRITVKEVNTAKGSYNDLVNQLSRLKVEWKATGEAGERAKLAAQINDVKERLEGMDHSIGNWQRNVGNYAGSLKDGFASVTASLSSMGGSLGAATQALTGMTSASKKFISTPLGVVIGAIAGAVAALVKGFKSSEDASNKLKVAFSALEPVGNAISNILTGIADKVGSFAQTVIPKIVGGVLGASKTVATALNKIGIVSDESLARFIANTDAAEAKYEEQAAVTQQITEREIALTKHRREVQVANARLEMEASEARTAAADKANLSATERLALLQVAADKQKAILDNELSIAKEEYALAEERAALTKNDASVNDDLAAKEAALYEARTRYANGMRELTSQMVEAQRSMGDALAQINDNAVEKMDTSIAALIEKRKYEAEQLAQINAEIDADYAALTADIDAYLAKQVKDEEEAANRRKKAQQLAGKGIVSVLTSVAAAMQANISMQLKNGEISEEEAEKQFKTVKAMQYATTLVNTFAGVTQALTDPAVPTFYLRAINAAAVLASGIASTIQIASTSMGSQGTISTTQTPSNIVAAPVVQQSIPVTRTVTNAEDEQKLNERTQSQRVYILSSDIEASQNARKVQVAETTF